MRRFWWSFIIVKRRKAWQNSTISLHHRRYAHEPLLVVDLTRLRYYTRKLAELRRLSSLVMKWCYSCVADMTDPVWDGQQPHIEPHHISIVVNMRVSHFITLGGDTIQTSMLALLRRLAWLKDMLRLCSWCEKSSVSWPVAPHLLFVFAASHNQMNILVFGLNVHCEPSRNDISTSLCLQSLIWTSSGHLRGPSTSTSTSAIRMGMNFFFANTSR